VRNVNELLAAKSSAITIARILANVHTVNRHGGKHEIKKLVLVEK